MSRGLRIGFGQVPTTLFASTGRYGILSAPSTTFQASLPTGLAFPRVALVAVGGDQSYGRDSTTGFTSYTAAASGTPAYTAVQLLGSYDLVIIDASFESAFNDSPIAKSDLVTAIKNSVVKNTSRGTYVFLYSVMESMQNLTTGGEYQTFETLCVNNDWWLWSAAGATGSKVLSTASGSGFTTLNYGYAYPVAPPGHSGLVDAPIAGNIYGSLSSSMGPATSAANYFATSLLTTNRSLDSRFASLPTKNAAPNADGLYLDNCFITPNGGGTLSPATASWDGVGIQGNPNVGPYTGVSGSTQPVSSMLARGQYHFFTQYQSYLASANPGATYLNFGNFGQYANTTNFGNVHTATSNAMDSVFNGGLIEAVSGIAAASLQAFQTGADVLADYNYGIAYCQNPQLVVVGNILPASDSSSTSTFTTAGSPATVASGTTLEYQTMRCMLTMTLMSNGFFGNGNNGYNFSLSKWYDEFGDDSLAQVNVSRGYLGFPVNSAITFSNGVMGRQFNGGYVLWNPWGNGVQTITSSQISAVTGNTYSLMHGTQQPSINTGAAFSTYTFADGDGLILVTPVSTGLTITNVNPLVPNATVGSFYDKQMNASGGTAPYTWSLVSATPSFGGWLSVTSTGLMQGTCPPAADAQTITVVVQLNDSASHSVQKSYSLIVNT